MLINQLNLASIPVYNAQVPEEGPKVLPLTFTFDQSGQAELDLSLLTNQNFISMVQSIFLDASAATGNVTVAVNGLPAINVKNNTQGYYPLVAPNPAKIMFTGTGTDTISVMLLNVPVAPGQWATV